MATPELRPVGWVRSPLKQLADAPNQGEGAPPARIEIEPWSARCWDELSVDDEVFVLTWLHRADRSVTSTHPEDDERTPLTGVFSTRSPDRPNPIGLHRTTIVASGDGWVEVARLEAVDGTPVVDVKPVIGRKADAAYPPKRTRPSATAAPGGQATPPPDEGGLEPVLEGDAPSDYERYLRTDELLSLQKSPETRVHRDELLFQVTHQASELWLKLASSEISEATDRVERGQVAAATRLVHRAVLSLEYVTEQLGMLEQLSPWEYRELRQALGHGSGFDSPGFAAIRAQLPALEHAFERQLEGDGLDLLTLYVDAPGHEALYQLAEELITLDARLQLWRMRHFRVVARVIGDDVLGTQGTPVEVLGKLIRVVAFPKLWEVRNTITARADPEGD